MPSRRAALLASLLALAPLLPATASAQDDSGAERYEVTITPPKRPGSEAAKPASGEAGTEVPGSKEAAGRDGDAAPSPRADEPEPGTDRAASPAAAAPAGAPAGSAAVASKDAAPAGPPHTLQVGAFRQQKSAQSLRDELAASFHDVTVLEVQSGGEPLYRVCVGRMPHGPALDEIRRRLVAAGHPAFEVPAPGQP